jgi:hypothetical protein
MTAMADYSRVSPRNRCIAAPDRVSRGCALRRFAAEAVAGHHPWTRWAMKEWVTADASKQDRPPVVTKPNLRCRKRSRACRGLGPLRASGSKVRVYRRAESRGRRGGAQGLGLDELNTWNLRTLYYYESSTGRASQREFVHALNRHGMVGSMGRVGAAGDNAAMESFFSLLEPEPCSTDDPPGQWRRWTRRGCARRTGPARRLPGQEVRDQPH